MTLDNELKVLNIGSPLFKEALEEQNVFTTQLNWKPVAGGNPELIKALDKVQNSDLIDKANEKAIKRLLSSKPVLAGMALAGEVIPDMTATTILHAGPPIDWERMSGPLRAAILGAMVFEGLADDLKAAEKRVEAGDITFSPCHEHQAVGPMAGVTSYSMPVFIIENKTYRNKAFCTVNEGLGKVLRYGANSEEVIRRLLWIKEVLYPILKEAISNLDEIDLKVVIAQALHMGDEGHNRNKAATSLIIRTLLPGLLSVDCPRDKLVEVLKFMNGNDHFFLNLSMPTAKVCLDAADNIEHSTMVTCMARNGTDFGIRISGLAGRWFTGPANFVKGLLFPGYTEDDCNPDIGDSSITETFGIGGFVMAGAPAIVQFVGGTSDDALNYTRSMYDITLTQNSAFSIPTLNFKGSPTGIDLRKVIEFNQLPVINTGIAHKVAGVGMVGAGVVYPPKICFEEALKVFAASEA
ncbi:MAG: hypothetical protein ACI9S8_000391 [Chlamydiales bacterium]|jgi:hypothetical protein